MSNPLNPQLYKALLKAFGDVRIANEGEAYIPMASSYGGRGSSPPAHAGEYYCVKCPTCRDTRPRLWINHRWGVMTSNGSDKDDHLYLAHCFNEECFTSREEQRALYEKVYPFTYGRRVKQSELTTSANTAASPEPVALKPVSMPPGLLSLRDPQSAHAAAYLESRGFDLDELEQDWGVRYCLYAPAVRPRIFQRIVVPIHVLRPSLRTGNPCDTILAGWQSRYVGDDVPQNQEKYWSMAGMKKSHLLYGLPRAVDHRGTPLIVVEGVTDVWRLGVDAVSPLGKNISQVQRQLLVRHFDGRPIVVFFDQGATAEARRAANDIRSMRRAYGDNSPVVVVTPPQGRDDVAECTRQEAWATVWGAL